MGMRNKHLAKVGTLLDGIYIHLMAIAVARRPSPSLLAAANTDSGHSGWLASPDGAE